MHAQRGQAAVELVAVLPLLAALLAGLWQAALIGEAAWSSASAARAAARAAAVGGSPRSAARAHLPDRLERGMAVAVDGRGRVRVTVRVPSPFGLHLGGTSSTAGFAPQR